MAKFERGVYEPGDEAHEGIRVYDGSEDEEDVEGSRLPLLIVLALLVLAMFGGVVWLAYTQGVARGRGETPVLAAAGGPERVAPQDPGGGNVPYQGFKIYEQPAPADDSAEPAPPAPVASAPQAAAPAAAESAKPIPAAPAPAAKSPAPAKTVAALIQQANSDPVKPAMAAAAAAKAAAPKPVAVAPATPAPGPAAATATGAPRQLGAPAAAAPKPVAAKPAAAPAAPAAAPAPGGAYTLQIGAFKSQAEAEAAWKSYKGKHAALLAGYSDNIQQVDLGDKGTWYRLKVGGFADREVASALCDRLKADGGACIPGR